MNKKEFVKKAPQKLRACINCAIILKAEEFRASGCPNCPFLYTKRDTNVTSITSAHYKGMIALLDPKTSWVGKWHRLTNYKPGLYAMIVEGELSDNQISMIEKDGRVYIPRSQSFELE